MHIKIFLKVIVYLTTGIGLALLVCPSTVGTIFLNSYAPGSDIFIRFLGSALIGYSYLNWYTSKYEEPKLMHATLVGNFATLFIASIVSIIGVLDQSLNQRGLLIVLLHISVGSGFGYYLYHSNKLRSSGIISSDT